MIKIGVVNIDVSHPLAFSKILREGGRARYAAVYNEGFRGRDEVEAFAASQGLERICRTVEELADCVDIGFIQGCNWDKHLEYAQVFIDRKKPVFIDKPMVGNLAECRKLEALAAGGAVILGSSSLRYAKEITDFMEIPVKDRGEIIHVMGTCGVDEFNYGIHVVEAVGGMLSGAVSTRFSSAGTVGGNECESYAVVFENGATADYITVKGVWLPCHFLVTTTKDVYYIPVDVGIVYRQLLNRICDYMETGENRLADVSQICESIKIMLAGRISRENGGTVVNLSEIPCEDPGYDGSLFEKQYAEKAEKIYLE